MKSFLVQVNDTQPAGWKTVRADSKGEAAARAAVRYAGVGRRTVYVVLGQDRHANGAPMAVQAYTVQVNPKEKP